jgi:hypothetical protein
MPNDDDLPPPELLDKLPPAEDMSERFAAGGWAGIGMPQTGLDWDVPNDRKPEMVKQDNEEAYRSGFRQR